MGGWQSGKVIGIPAPFGGQELGAASEVMARISTLFGGQELDAVSGPTINTLHVPKERPLSRDIRQASTDAPASRSQLIRPILPIRVHVAGH